MGVYAYIHIHTYTYCISLSPPLSFTYSMLFISVHPLGASTIQHLLVRQCEAPRVESLCHSLCATLFLSVLQVTWATVLRGLSDYAWAESSQIL